jgi:hypothetical protein
MTGPIPAAHVWWTRPRPTNARPLATFEAVALAVSCLLWTEFNGPVRLFTDAGGLARLDRMGLLPFWDEIDTRLLAGMPEAVAPDAFWDVGKTVVLGELPAGTCVLDLDLVVWGPLRLPEDAVGFLHWEQPAGPWYPGPEGLSCPPGYAFDPDFDWAAPLCNTAFMTARDGRFRRAFVGEALGFAAGNRPAGAGIAEMLFAGQRLFAHVGRKLGARLVPLVDHVFHPEGPWPGPDDPLALAACERGVAFTHLWRHKWPLLADPAAGDRFRRWLIRRCLALAPDLAGRRANLENLKGG